MSTTSESARKALKEKAQRLAAPSKGDIDASGWSEPTMNAEAKTGARPISPRAFKRGGKVEGDKAKAHAGHKPRKSGGRADEDCGTSFVNRDAKKASAERGEPHVGGFKKGGEAKRRHRDLGGGTPYGNVPGIPGGKGNGIERKVFGMKAGGKAKRAEGGPVDNDAPKPIMAPVTTNKQSYNPVSVNKAIEASTRAGRRIGGGEARLIHSILKGRTGKAKGGKANSESGTRPTGGRIARAHGGKAGKGKTAINILISTGPKQDPSAAAPPPMMPPMGGAAPPMPPPMTPDPSMGAAPPMMGRATGGRTGKMVGGPMLGAPMGMSGPAMLGRPVGPPSSMPPAGMNGPAMLGRPMGGPPMPPPTPMPPVPAAQQPFMSQQAMMPQMGQSAMPQQFASANMPAPAMGGGIQPMGRKDGGKVGRRSYKSAADMDAGAGGGFGRLEKAEIHKGR